MKRPYPDKQMTQRAATVQLTLLLQNATPERILAMTVDSLCATHNVDRRVVECKLLAAQGRVRRMAVAEGAQ